MHRIPRAFLPYQRHATSIAGRMDYLPHVVGKSAERIAEQDYLDRGYTSIARNFRCRGGEIDLLLFRDGELVLVEVKARRQLCLDDAWLARWYRKKSRLSRALTWFLAVHPEWAARAEEYRLEIVFITQGRVSERYTEEPYCG